jgi:hypothetical protein
MWLTHASGMNRNLYLEPSRLEHDWHGYGGKATNVDGFVNMQ